MVPLGKVAFLYCGHLKLGLEFGQSNCLVGGYGRNFNYLLT